MATFNDLFARLDPDPRVRGKQFEHVCKWFLENDPYYRDTVRKVWLWDDWEHRWGGDAGIDLVAEESDGKLWAVQCKAYDPDRAVTKKDVDKFLSESSRKWFSYRLLIATTDRLHHRRPADYRRPGEEGRVHRSGRPAHRRGRVGGVPGSSATRQAAKACQAAQLPERSNP